MNHAEFCISWGTKLVYSYSKLTPGLKEYWSELLRITFEDAISPERLTFLESKSSVKKSNVLDALKHENPNEDQWILVLSLIQLLREKAEQVHEIPSVKGLDFLISEIDGLAKLDQSNTRLQSTLKELESKLDHHFHRITIKVPILITPLIIDHILRWILVWNVDDTDALFWIINALLLPTITLIFSAFIWRVNQRKNLSLLDEYEGKKNYKLQNKITSGQYSTLVLLVLIAILVVTILSEGDFIRILGTLLGFLIYYFIYLNLFATGRLSEKDLLDQLDRQPHYYQDLDADQNDEVMVDLQTRLQSTTSRLEAYVLESALFGALAFSGFLQIMAEQLITFNDLQQFADNCLQLFTHVVNLQLTGVPDIILVITSRSGLFSMISLETLICSIMFLSVIAARLRFSDIADRVDRSLKLAKRFNEKEENLFERGVLKEKSQERFVILNTRIQKELMKTHQELENMVPVTSYMRFFRNAGITTFLIILISSGLFISGLLSLMFALLGISTVIYFNRGTIREWGLHVGRNFRILFVRKGYYFLIAGILVYIIGVYIRVGLKSPESDWVVMVGGLLIGLFFFSTISVTPLLDKKFEEAIGNKSYFNPRTWNIVRLVWGGATFFFFVGFLLKFIEWIGAGAITSTAITVLAILFIILGYQFSLKKWLGLVIGLFLSIQTFGILFKTLHLPGAGSLLIAGLLVLPIILVSFTLYRNQFHRILIYAATVTSLLGFFMVWGTYNAYQLGYQYYTFDTEKIHGIQKLYGQAREIESSLTENIDNSAGLDSMINENIELFENYRNEFESRIGFGRIHIWVMYAYYGSACELLEKGHTKDQYEQGLRLVQAINAAGERFHYLTGFFYDTGTCPLTSFLPSLETDLLLKLSRKEEAIKAQTKFIEYVTYDHKEEMKKKLNDIQIQ